MKHQSARLLLALGLAIPTSFAMPLSAQHGAAHGGFAGHTASTFHGASGFHGSFNTGPHAAGLRTSQAAPMRYAPASRFASPGSSAPGYPASNRFNPYRTSALRSSANTVRPAYPSSTSSDRYRRPYRPHGREGLVYGYGAVPIGGWYDPGYYPYTDYPDSAGYDDSQDSSNYVEAPYNPDPAAVNQPAPYNYTPPDAAQSRPSSTPESDDAVTLIFKDGRPQEQIHNYLLSRTTLTVLDHRRHDIPVAQLDIAATEKTNRDAGIDFHLPELAQ